MKDQFGEGSKILWHDRKRWCGMPLSFTRYYLVENEDWLKLYSSIGFLSIRGEEVNLYRVYDISIRATLSNRIFGTGTLILHCSSNSSDEVHLIRIKNPYKVRAMLSELIEQERAKRGNRISEFTY